MLSVQQSQIIKNKKFRPTKKTITIGIDTGSSRASAALRDFRFLQFVFTYEQLFKKHMSNYNSRHLRLAAEAISTEINDLSQIEVKFNVYSNRLHFADANYVNKVLPRCLQILKGNLGTFYEAHGPLVYGYQASNNTDEWVQYKWNEMLEKDLVYITVADRDNPDNVCGFISFALSDSLSSQPESDSTSTKSTRSTRSTKPCLFLYEIHLERSWQSRGIGSLIFSKILEPLALDMNSPSLELCVFTSNNIALNWYRNIGFKTSVIFSKDLIGMSKPIRS